MRPKANWVARVETTSKESAIILLSNKTKQNKKEWTPFNLQYGMKDTCSLERAWTIFAVTDFPDIRSPVKFSELANACCNPSHFVSSREWKEKIFYLAEQQKVRHTVLVARLRVFHPTCQATNTTNLACLVCKDSFRRWEGRGIHAQLATPSSPSTFPACTMRHAPVPYFGFWRGQG